MRRLATMAAVVGLAVVSPVTAIESIKIEIQARSVQPGELLILTATTTSPLESVSVRAFGHEFPAFRIDGLTWRSLVGVDLETPAKRYPVLVTGRTGKSSVQAESVLAVTTRSFPTRRLQVEPSFVNPSPEAQERIAREAADLNRVWAQSASDRLWNAAFVRPVSDPSNSRFGSRSIFNGQPRSPHGGDDFLSPTGTPIYAPNAGRIVLARDLYFTGNTIVIDHGQNLFSMLAHLSAFDVQEGETVSAGQPVGLTGATGRVTGPHLHWAVRLAGTRIDPLSLLAMLGADAPPAPHAVRPVGGAGAKK